MRSFMEKTKIAVLVSGGGINLQALLDKAARGEMPNGQIALVLSNKKDAYALTRAEKAGVPTAVVEKQSCRTSAEFEEQILAHLRAHNIEMIVLAGFMCILSEAFTKAYPRRIVNVHPSLIPAFCGAGFYGLHVHEAALAYGVKVTGATVHFVNEIPDGGEIILQKAVDILPSDTAETLQKRVMEEAEWILLPKAVEMVAKDIAESKEV